MRLLPATKKVKPGRTAYFNKRSGGGWTFHCPHEPKRSVMITIIGRGEVVTCHACSQKIAAEFVRCAEWKT